MNLFIKDAEEIFTQAGLTKEDAPQMFLEASDILSGKMAHLSATLGLSQERINAYNEQKRMLVYFLNEAKSKRELK